MGEALVIKAIGGGGGSGSGGAPTQGQFIANVDYLCTKTGNYQIICVGGGGGGSLCYNRSNNSRALVELEGFGGGAGYFTWTIAHMNEGDVHKMTIGAGGVGSRSNGVAGNTGGTTSFGTLLSALGGGGGPINTASGVGTNQNAVGGVGGANGIVHYSRYNHNSSNSWYGYGYPGILWTTPDLNTGLLRIVGQHANQSFNVNGINTETAMLAERYGSRLAYGDGGNAGAYNFNNSTVVRYGVNGVQGCIFVNYIN